MNEQIQICILLIEPTEETFQSNLARLATGFPRARQRIHTHTCDTHHSLNVYAASERARACSHVCGHTKSAYFSDVVCFAVTVAVIVLVAKISIALGAWPKYTEFMCVLCSLVTCSFCAFFF